MQNSLEVYSGPDLVFSSTGKWLHPLFELEVFLKTQALAPASLRVRDKIIGRAAALILVHLGFRQIHTGILSRPAQEAFAQHHITCTYEVLVDQITCRTEELLRQETDPQKAYQVVAERRRQKQEPTCK
jgi:zinc transport system ATP-binding protein